MIGGTVHRPARTTSRSSTPSGNPRLMGGGALRPARPLADIQLPRGDTDPDESPGCRHAPPPWPDFADPASWSWQLSGLSWSTAAAISALPRCPHRDRGRSIAPSGSSRQDAQLTETRLEGPSPMIYPVGRASSDWSVARRR